MVLETSKRRKQIDRVCVAAWGAKKTRFLKMFDIRKFGIVQNGAKVAPKRGIVAKRLQKGMKMQPKGSQRNQKEPGGSPKKPKGSQKGAKRNPKQPNVDPNPSKNRLGRQGRFWKRKGG